MTDKIPLLDQLDQARAKATPGEWAQHPADSDYVIGDISDGGESYVDVADAIGGSDSADASCIVAEHNAIPQLAAVIRAVAELADSYPLGTDVPVYRLHRILATLTPGADTAGATA